MHSCPCLKEDMLLVQTGAYFKRIANDSCDDCITAIRYYTENIILLKI